MTEPRQKQPCPQPPKQEFRHAEPYECSECGKKSDDPSTLCFPVKRK